MYIPRRFPAFYIPLIFARQQLKISEICTLFQPIELQIFCILTIKKVTLISAVLFFLWFDQYYDSYLGKKAYGYFNLLNSFFSTQLLFSRLYHINFDCHSNDITSFNIWIWISLIESYCRFIDMCLFPCQLLLCQCF